MTKQQKQNSVQPITRHQQVAIWSCGWYHDSQDMKRLGSYPVTRAPNRGGRWRMAKQLHPSTPPLLQLMHAVKKHITAIEIATARAERQTKGLLADSRHRYSKGDCGERRT